MFKIIYKNKLKKFHYMLLPIKELWDKKQKNDTHLKFYKILTLPCLMYGSETWTVGRTCERELEAAGILYL
jgi:hypothetical protein